MGADGLKAMSRAMAAKLAHDFICRSGGVWVLDNALAEAVDRLKQARGAS